MRVLQINATYGIGSTGEIVSGIAQVASKCQIETYFASAIRPNVECDYHFFTVGNLIDHKIHALNSRILGMQGRGSYLATKKLLKWIDKINPDIIHLHNIHNNYVNIKLLFEYIATNGIPTVITLHDCWYFTGKCCHFLYDHCDKWKNGCGNCPRRWKEIPSYFFDKSELEFREKHRLIGENPYVHVVGCSEWLTACAKKSLLGNRVEKTIHNGIDLDIFKPMESKLRDELHIENKFVILGMANKWMSEENAETLTYIVNNMDSSTVLLLIGCSSSHIQNNKNTNILMKGFIKERKILAAYYSMADVFVNVTKVDSFPTVNIEALACGTPVITYNSGGSGESVDEQTGFIVPYSDYESLFQSIRTVQEKGKSFYSNHCYLRAKQLYDKNVRFMDYIGLYNKILT